MCHYLLIYRMNKIVSPHTVYSTNNIIVTRWGKHRHTLTAIIIEYYYKLMLYCIHNEHRREDTYTYIQITGGLLYPPVDILHSYLTQKEAGGRVREITSCWGEGDRWPPPHTHINIRYQQRFKYCNTDMFINRKLILKPPSSIQRSEILKFFLCHQNDKVSKVVHNEMK